MRLNEIIRQYIENRNWSIREFAAHTRMSETYINACLMENRGMFIPYYVARRLYKAFPEESLAHWEQVCQDEYYARNPN